MPYLIDGHNLIGHLRDITLDDPNDEARLVQKLRAFAARTSRRCVVVFDHGLPGGPSRLSTRAVQVIFASQGSSADRVMIERINETRIPGEWTVVSSDRDVLAAARRRRMRTHTAEAFAALLKPTPDRSADADEKADRSLSPGEVDEWLDIFGGDEE